MDIVSRVAQAMQSLLGDHLDELGTSTGVIQRKRVFTASTLARTLIFGFLAKPRATWDELAFTAAQCGAQVSPQALEQRFTPALVTFLHQLVLRATEQIVVAQPVTVDLFKRFNGVYLSDSTIVRLPDEYAEQWPGCGGSPGAGRSSLKIQLCVDWLCGAISNLQLEPGHDSDLKSTLQQKCYPRGALRIADLGYYCLKTLGKIAANGAYFLSRIQCTTTVFDEQGGRRNVIAWLEDLWTGQPLDLKIQLGNTARLSCRLLACRVPAEVANRRRQRLHEHGRRKGYTPSAEKLAWCDWNIYVTNVEGDRLSWQECVVLYRTRWQMELIFKLWKSEGALADLTRGTAHRQMATLLARLLAMILQHWCLLSSVWHLPARSLRKAAQQIRMFALTMAGCFNNHQMLTTILTQLRYALEKIAKVNKRRKHSSHYQLAANPEILQFSSWCMP